MHALDPAEAVAAPRQRVRVPAQPVLSCIKRIFPVMWHTTACIRHHHLAVCVGNYYVRHQRVCVRAKITCTYSVIHKGIDAHTAHKV
jgi:hypothetical protein